MKDVSNSRHGRYEPAKYTPEAVKPRALDPCELVVTLPRPASVPAVLPTIDPVDVNLVSQGYIRIDRQIDR
jgi:hypothetical protein